MIGQANFAFPVELLDVEPHVVTQVVRVALEEGTGIADAGKYLGVIDGTSHGILREQL